MSGLSARERAIRQRLKTDLDHYAVRCLRIRTKTMAIEPLNLNRSQRYVHEQLEERRRRGRITRLEATRRMNRLAATIDTSGFGRADLVIEAVFEDLALKRRVLAEVEEAAGDRCVVASNTSSIPIGDLARGARRPGRILGMHFFSPVEKMPLLEIVVTSDTEAWATATAVAFGRRLGKHVIVVRDGPGFYTTRALSPYLSEAARLVEEGAAVEDVDGAMKRFGFPVGPLALMDEVGLDVGAKVSGVLHKAFGERMRPPEGMATVIESGRLGRKGGRGFYAYDGAKKRVDESLYTLLPRGLPRAAFVEREIQERLVFAFLNEAARCFEEGILRSPRDGDVGAIFGLGFPPFLGGPFRYLDHLGPRFAAEVLDRLAARHGARFAPAASAAPRDCGVSGPEGSTGASPRAARAGGSAPSESASASSAAAASPPGAASACTLHDSGTGSPGVSGYAKKLTGAFTSASTR